MNSSLYHSAIVDRYRLFNNLTPLHTPEKRIIAMTLSAKRNIIYYDMYLIKAFRSKETARIFIRLRSTRLSNAILLTKNYFAETHGRTETDHDITLLTLRSH